MAQDNTQSRDIKRKMAAPSSCSGSGESTGGEIREEKQRPLDKDRENTAQIASDDDTPDGLQLKRPHTHTMGILKLRPDDDTEPSDWWFVSTAVPLIAATFAPMANVLSIAALVVSWRNKLINDGPTAQADSVGIPDPHWCVALNIASLVCGFVGNLFLLFNFTKRVRYIVALPATIILFYFASGILIGITVSMEIYVPPGPGEIYSQGFWHAIIAACLYLFNSVILMVNMWGYFLGHYPQHFTLTDEQRNLILQTMLFFIWLAGGAALFARIEGWNYPDALYFCDVTILTIGFGDIYATDDLGRGFVFPFSVGGTIILGLMVSSIHKFAGELSKDQVLRKHVENRRVNTLSRVVTLSDEEMRRDDIEKHLDFQPRHLPTISQPTPLSSPLTEKDMADRKIAFGDVDREKVAQPSANQFLSSKFHKGPISRTFRMIAAPVVQLRRVASRNQKALVMREEKDRFDAMRGIQENAAKFKKWYALMISIIAFGILWCVGAIGFWKAERETQNMTYFQALYFCYVSLLTIGYGDLSPKSNAGKPFFIVWSLIAVPTMTILISDMGDTVISKFKQGTFKVADFTVLPKQGLYKDFMQANPWLWNWLQRRAEKKRIAKGLPVDPAPSDEDPLPPETIEQLASEKLDEGEMAKKLAFAIRKTADDLRRNSRKKYSFEEWVEFARLIRFTKVDIEEMEYDEEQDGVVEWDWLAENSPMLSDQTEAEWILDRLCESLLRLLKKTNLGVVPEPKSVIALPGGFIPFSFSQPRQRGGDEDSVAPGGDFSTKNGAATPTEPSITKAQLRRRRASGADAMLTFFTGERRGTNAYARMDPQWSRKALERMQERRRSSASHARKGPFSKLDHNLKTGAIGGGRGGAGSRTLKAHAIFGSVDRTM